MKFIYRVLRFVVVILLSLLVVVPTVTYVALSLTSVQSNIASEVEHELSRLLNCRVTIGDLGIVPFNRVVLRNVTVETTPGDTVMTVRRLGAGVRLWSLVDDGPITVNYIELIGMDARLKRDSIGAPLNIQPIIDALKPKEKKKKPTAFDLKINTVLLRASKFKYDILSEPLTPQFNPNHIAVANLRADIRLPRIKNDDFVVNIKRMGLSERSGFRMENLTAEAFVSAKKLALKNFSITLPSSHLAVNDTKLKINGLSNITDALKTEKIEVAINPESFLTPADFAPFVPKLSQLRKKVEFRNVHAEYNRSSANAEIDLLYGKNSRLTVIAEATDIQDKDLRQIKIKSLTATTTGNDISKILSDFTNMPHAKVRTVSAVGNVRLDASAKGKGNKYNGSLTLTTNLGGIDVIADCKYNNPDDISAKAEVATQGFIDISAQAMHLGLGHFGGADGVVTAEFSRKGKHNSGHAEVILDHLLFKGYDYTDLHVNANLEDKIISGNATINNEAVAFNLSGAWLHDKHTKALVADGEIVRFIPSALNLWNKYPDANISAKLNLALKGKKLENIPGHITLSDVTFAPANANPIVMESLIINADSTSLVLNSDFIDGKISGRYSFPDIAATVTDIFSHSFPAITGSMKHRDLKADDYNINDFTFDFKIKSTEKLAEFFRLPVSVIYPVTLKGEISDKNHDLALTVNAPYLRQGTKLIENTRLSTFINGNDGEAGADFTITAPTKNGPLTLNLQSAGRHNSLTTGLDWKIARKRAYNGSIGAVATFSRDSLETPAPLQTRIDLLPGTLTFNDSTWTVNPAKINIAGPKNITVEGVNVHRTNQFVKIDGTVSDNLASLLTLDLRNFSLDYLFESLGIETVMLGGKASGIFYASQLLSPEPILETPGLNVTKISYNKTILGDAVVKSRWLPDEKAVSLNAVISQEDGRTSFVDGAIFPLKEALDITFKVDHVNVSFMQPYMSAFSSDITGHASGRARLYGTFKYIDLEGDVKADDLRMKINFTNTYYTASDSVHFRPGFIDLNGITVRDAEGHTAKLNGWVKHKFFKEPRFEFGITGAYHFLSYNETSRNNPLWYGKIYGNGSAFVKGEPGRVDISVDMATAPRSTFTFVLSDQEVADEYSFLTFRDKAKLNAPVDTASTRDTSMDIVNELKALVNAHNTDNPSDYNISLQMRVTPEAQIVLVMDPVGGDRIKAFGNGHLRMDYGSANNDLKMYGTYALDRGHYNFTLQDVIIKDFTIRPGSEISFNGDPYGAQLDIQAQYSLNANLSDLDESFLQDKDLNRTNVPVHALMNVTGDIRQPEIKFDLEFPTLTNDIYRKVRSIISTDDMMNRQIIYLLALNRFYTPEYMASTTKGNELVSVASSTISSQISNMLGQISENWNIAPTFRSDRGDFSDVEFDVALSSRLLNNRLLFNGNFGYRDNALNSNQFIGDFDLEYILDREGMWRLKAYNRYNDQNYYLRTAHTTQGVGIVLKRDFDSFFSFLRKFRKKKKNAADTTATQAATPPKR